MRRAEYPSKPGSQYRIATDVRLACVLAFRLRSPAGGPTRPPIHQYRIRELLVSIWHLDLAGKEFREFEQKLSPTMMQVLVAAPP